MKNTEHILCYNTNGFSCHTLEDATRILADQGYGGVALTPDVHHLNPFTSTADDLKAYAVLLEQLRLSVVIEGGARFVLDPRRKHYPGFFTPGEGERRVDFLKRCVDMAAALGSTVVAFHSGKLEGNLSRDAGFETLVPMVDRLLDHARPSGVTLALEPEPGMFIETLEDYRKLKGLLSQDDLKMTLDVGHVHITENQTIDAVIREFAGEILNVHLDDAKAGRHEHLPLDEGEIRFPPIFEALKDLKHRAFLSVELSRHSHDAVNQASKAIDFIMGCGY